METVYLWLSNFVVIFHLVFILFVLLGGLLVLYRRKWMWLHLPAVTWGFLVELEGWYCPLTPWENHFRKLAGQTAYEGDFIGEYLLPVIYPAGLTREIQYLLAAIVIVFNVVIYYFIWRKYTKPTG